MATNSLAITRPPWLNKKIRLNDCLQTEKLLLGLNLHSVCLEAQCPNRGECFGAGEATFLILGKYCTRHCRFCAITKGIPTPVDDEEPMRIAHAVKALGLHYVVITSVTRDDLEDGGAEAFARTIQVVATLKPQVKIEILIPDFNENIVSIRKVIAAKPTVIAHNIETIPALYPTVREGSSYQRSLRVLNIVAKHAKEVKVKSGLMLGLGENENSVFEVLRDLRKTGCEFLSIGQYLSPGKNCLPVKEYVALEKFEYYKNEALALGFQHVKSGPYVRSSYHAHEYFPE